MGYTYFEPFESSTMFGWEQQVFVQAKGKVFLSDDLRWKRSLFSELNKKMLKARWGMEPSAERYLLVCEVHLSILPRKASVYETETSSFKRTL